MTGVQTCALPIYFDEREFFAGGTVVGEVVKRVKEQLRAVPGDGLGYGLLRYLSPAGAAVLSEGSRPRVAFNYLGRFPAREGTDWDLAPEEIPAAGPAPAAHAITVNAVTEDGAGGPWLRTAWSWPADLWPAGAMAELAGRWQQALEGLVAYAARPGAGGLTPSDVPLVSLSQEDIDQIEADWLDRE